MKKAILVSVFIAVAALRSFGQQDAMFSQYMFNQLLINPAYAGNHEVINANLLFRDQWVNIEGAPVTETFSVDAPLNKDKVGVGFTAYNDKIGITGNTGFYLTYAYRIKFKKSILALGVQGGVSHLQANYTDVKYSLTNNTNDVAFAYNLNQYTPNFGTGLFFNTDRFYVGLSVPYLLRKSMLQSQNLLGYTQYQHFFLTSGYVVDINTDVKVKPSFLVKYVEGAPVEVDSNANVWLYDVLSIGASYRTGDSFDAILEVQLSNQLKIGYAFDYSVSALQRFNYGSHELMLNYEFVFKKSRIITPRYF